MDLDALEPVRCSDDDLAGTARGADGNVQQGGMHSSIGRIRSLIELVPSCPIRIVLVDTSHPGNIGAAARAMKNMELTELALVRPRSFPHAEATARASGADDVLERARGVRDRSTEALAGCGLVFACTSRERDHYYRVLDVRDAAARAVAECASTPPSASCSAPSTAD